MIFESRFTGIFIILSLRQRGEIWFEVLAAAAEKSPSTAAHENGILRRRKVLNRFKVAH